MDFNKEYKLLDRSEDMNDELIDRPEPIYHTVLSAKFVASFLKRMFYSTWNPTEVSTPEIQELQYPVVQVQKTTLGLINGKHCFSSLLKMGHHQKFSRTLFNVGNSSGFVFLFHQFEIQDATSNTIDDALYACVDFIQSPDSAENSIVFSFHDSSEDSSNMHDKPLKQDTFLIMQRITFINQWSLLSLDEMQILKQNGIAPRRRRFIQFGSCRSRLVSNTSESTPHLTLAILTGVMLAVVLGILGTLATVRFTSQCPLSIGPPHQLDYTQFNITEWAKSNINNDTQWAIRFDDQALIPAHLYTDEEAYYQMWYRNRYKEQALLVSEEAHLNETWLYSNESYVPADTQFHISHCVLTLRRYWIARETGHHICSWDLDHGHIHHCLETLDNLIFDDNPRQVRDNSSLHWNTKLCY